MKSILHNLKLYCILCFLSGMSAANAARNAQGIGQVAKNLMEPVGLFSSFVNTGCFIIGGGFLFATIIKYMEHKRSPIMTPISTVIFLLIAGIVLILLPFISILTGYGVFS